MTVIVEDVYLAISSAEESNMIIIPSELKEVVVDSIYSLKIELAQELLKEFDSTEFTFEVGDEVFHLLREAVATQTGGEMTDEY